MRYCHVNELNSDVTESGLFALCAKASVNSCLEACISGIMLFTQILRISSHEYVQFIRKQLSLQSIFFKTVLFMLFGG